MKVVRTSDVAMREFHSIMFSPFFDILGQFKPYHVLASLSSSSLSRKTSWSEKSNHLSFWMLRFHIFVAPSKPLDIRTCPTCLG